MQSPLNGWGSVCTAAFVLSLSASPLAQSNVTTAETMVVCAAKAAERQTCAADTSGGVSLIAVIGTAVCEQNTSWGYDETGIWVANGCAAVFAITTPPSAAGTYGPAGFKVADTRMGDLNIKLFSYVRYLNQQGFDDAYVDAFGQVKPIDARQDIQFQKVNLQTLGWIASRRLRYLAYVWTSNTSQGLGAQVVVGGNLKFAFNPHVTIGGGIGALPGTRSLEGNFPYWLPVDNRLMADEFFRPSYTMGIWAEGRITDGLEYIAMLGNNLSQLGVDAGQLDSGLDTVSMSLAWLPTTGEFGRGFGDYERHKQMATRIGIHFTHSDENRQSQPDTEAIENSQIRTSDGNIIFTPGLFGPDTAITDAQYAMTALDAGVKYRGLSLEGEAYWRSVSNLRGPNTALLPFTDLHDTGFKLESSAMVMPRVAQIYLSGSKIFGEYGDPWDFRAGVSYYPFENEIVRWNAEYLYVRRSPVGALSLPVLVGGNGPVFYSSFMVNF